MVARIIQHLVKAATSNQPNYKPDNKKSKYHAHNYKNDRRYLAYDR